jgi:hypothetical protein
MSICKLKQKYVHLFNMLYIVVIINYKNILIFIQIIIIYFKENIVQKNTNFKSVVKKE